MLNKRLKNKRNKITYSGGSRPSAKEGARLTMNVDFCEDNSVTSKEMRYFRKNKVEARAPLNPPLTYM